MKVLIAGGQGSFCQQVIARLKRENHDVYVIAGKDSAKIGGRMTSGATFYSFGLADKKLKFIIDSIMPDAIVFLGAYDENYDFLENKTTVSDYLADLSNLLEITALTNVNRFVYLSTSAVYGEKQNIPLNENCGKNPDDAKCVVISEGEALCFSFAGLSGTKVTALRFSEIYGFISGKTPGLIEKIFAEAVDTSQVPGKPFKPDADKKINPIYVSDAVDAVYKAVTNEQNTGVYNVSGTGTELSYIYKKIKELSFVPAPVSTAESDSDIAESAIFQAADLTVDCNLFREQYGYNPLVDIDGGLERMYRVLSKHNEKTKKKVGKNLKNRELFESIAPFLENLLLFAALILISIWQQPDSVLAIINFTVLYIIIIAVTFGLFQSWIAIFLSIALLVWQKADQGMSVFDMVINLDVMIRILEFFIIGTICGYSKDRMSTAVNEKNSEIADNKKELEMIYEINDSNMNIKHELNERLTNYEDSLAKLYTVVDKLNELQPDAVFFAAVDVVRDIMSTDDVSIYIITGDNFKMCRLMARTPSSVREIKKSVPLADLGELAECAEHDEIFVNRDLRENLPMMASPIFVDNKLVSIVMIWNMDFENLTLYSENRFLVLSRLISSVIGRAYSYTQNMQNSMYLPGTRVLTEEAFENVLNIHKEAAKNNTASYRILLVSGGDMKMDGLSEKAEGLIRTNDYIGQCPDTDNNIYILLTNTNSDDARFVFDRLKKAGLDIMEVAL